VNLRHLPDVQARHRRKNEIPAKARAAKVPKITAEKYRSAQKRARSRKELFSLLSASGPAVLKFEKKYPDIRRN
jgi:hypothetical protein